MQCACGSGLLAEYVNAARLGLELDTIVRCRATGDYSLDPAGKGPVTGLAKAWRVYRFVGPFQGTASQACMPCACTL